MSDEQRLVQPKAKLLNGLTESVVPKPRPPVDPKVKKDPPSSKK